MAKPSKNSLLTHGECMTLIRNARRATKLAYAPYSRYRVGAALLSRDGRIWTGANIENGAYPLSMCAERTALARAIMDGAGDGSSTFTGIAISTDGKATPWPCGACRQVLAELAPKAQVIVDLGGGEYADVYQSDLLPKPFTLPVRQRATSRRK